MRVETEEGTLVTSCVTTSASAAVLEMDDARISLASELEVKELEEGNVVSITAGDEHLVIVADWNQQPARFCVMTGKGSFISLVELARENLQISAHQQVDQLAAANAGQGSTPDPETYLFSRLRAPQGRLKHAWIAGPQGEPDWHPARLYNIVLALMATGHRELASGLITNFTASMDLSGNGPASGGFMQPLLRQPTSWPVLNHLIATMIKSSAHGSPEVHYSLSELSDYLEAAREYAARRPPDQTIDAAFHALLLRQEMESLAWLREHHGRPGIDLLSASARDGIPPATTEDARLKPWFDLLQPTLSGTPAEKEEMLRACSLQLTRPEDLEPGILPMLATMISSSHNLDDPPELGPDWRAHLADLAGQRWRQDIANHDTSDAATLLADASFAVLARANAGRRKSIAVKGMRATLWWMNRRQRWIAASGIVAILLFAVWVISVHFRSLMPLPVFTTRIGQIEQHYLTGDYAAALAALDELDRAGNVGPDQTGFLRGKIFYRQGRHHEALTTFAGLVEKDIRMPASKYNLALCHIMVRDYEGARRLFEEIAVTSAVTHPATAGRARRAAAITAMMQEYDPEPP